MKLGLFTTLSLLAFAACASVTDDHVDARADLDRVDQQREAARADAAEDDRLLIAGVNTAIYSMGEELRHADPAWPVAAQLSDFHLGLRGAPSSNPIDIAGLITRMDAAVAAWEEFQAAAVQTDNRVSALERELAAAQSRERSLLQKVQEQSRSYEEMRRRSLIGRLKAALWTGLLILGGVLIAYGALVSGLLPGLFAWLGLAPFRAFAGVVRGVGRVRKRAQRSGPVSIDLVDDTLEADTIQHIKYVDLARRATGCENVRGGSNG